MKFIAVSDVHLEKNLYGQPALGADLRDLFNLAATMAIEQQVDYLIVAGDLFDHNRPPSDTIEYVSGVVKRLRRAGVTPLAIAGDHAKPVNGNTWEKVAGFSHISSIPCFAGADYSDEPSQVIQEIQAQLDKAAPGTIEYIFLHGQMPELWPFCEEKKALPLEKFDLTRHTTSLHAIILGDIHKPMSKRVPLGSRQLYLGYCGSLGVTSGDELNKQGMMLWEDGKLTLLPYELPRKFITVELKGDDVAPVLALESLRNTSPRPVILIKLLGEMTPAVAKAVQELNSIGIVKTTKVRITDTGEEEHINIRSELKTSDRFEQVLAELLKDDPRASEVQKLALQLITAESPRDVLEQAKLSFYPSKENVA